MKAVQTGMEVHSTPLVSYTCYWLRKYPNSIEIQKVLDGKWQIRVKEPIPELVAKNLSDLARLRP